MLPLVSPEAGPGSRRSPRERCRRLRRTGATGLLFNRSTPATPSIHEGCRGQTALANAGQQSHTHYARELRGASRRKTSARIVFLAVLPEYRRRGIGTALPRDRNRPMAPPVLSARIRALNLGRPAPAGPLQPPTATPQPTSHHFRSRLPSPPLRPTTTPRVLRLLLRRVGEYSVLPPPMGKSRSDRTGTEASVVGPKFRPPYGYLRVHNGDTGPSWRKCHRTSGAPH